MLGQQWQSEQIGGGALVASARGLAVKIVPLIHGSIAPAEPCQGNEIDLLILIERADERRQLFIDRIVGLVLEHVDHPVVGRIGPGFRIGDDILGLELPCLGDDVADLLGADVQDPNRPVRR